MGYELVTDPNCELQEEEGYSKLKSSQAPIAHLTFLTNDKNYFITCVCGEYRQAGPACST